MSVTAPYAELAVTTCFSFLQGASHPEELVQRAAGLGLKGLAVTDRNSLAGVVRAHVAAKAAGLRLVVGCRLVSVDGPDLLCFPSDRAAYGRLTRLLSRARRPSEHRGALTPEARRAFRKEGRLQLDAIRAAAEGQLFVALSPEGREDAPAFAATLADLAEAWPGRLWLGATPHFRGDEAARFAYLEALGQQTGAPMVAVGDVLYHRPERRPLHDVMTCIRLGHTLEGAGFALLPNAERHLKGPEAMARLFAAHPEALAQTLEILERARFSLDELAYEYPDEPVPEGQTPQGHLEALTWAGAARRYPGGVPDKVRAALTKELALIAELSFAPYFLTVHDIVAFAEARGILAQGRGSAANSAVCYCLGITAVDPAQSDLLFERFISKERREPPDIDVDFEHERREEVIQYIYTRYGRERAALAATVITYRPKMALREVAKVMGLGEDVGAALSGTVWGSWGHEIAPEHVAQAGLDPANPVIRRLVTLAKRLIGFPRHLSQHVGGFVLTRGRLDESVPIADAAMPGRSFVEWDKDDLAALGLMKIDVLALGMLSCIRRCFALIEASGGPSLSLANLPQEDSDTYAMVSKADTLGVFQIESRAQMAMLPRLRPRTFYDLVIEVAIVRPGPIQGDMVHPYLRRRQGKEVVTYPSPAPEHGPPDELRRILGRTLGVPLFQEQAMRIAIEAAQFTPEEANGLRRAMATFRKVGTIPNYRERMVSRMIERGYAPEFATRCFDQIQGFGEYGFPESHAASFALLVYVSAYLKCHYPAAFAAALIDAQPMGFYSPAQIVRDATAHGVAVLAADVNRSGVECSLEPSNEGKPHGTGLGQRHALRLGLARLKGMRAADVEALLAARAEGPFQGPADLQARTGLSRTVVVTLAEADAFASCGLDRRQALWAARGLAPGTPLPLFAAARAPETAPETAPKTTPEPEAALRPAPWDREIAADYRTQGLSLKGHPVAPLRERLRAAGFLTLAEAQAAPNFARVRTAGIVSLRQKPPTAKGVVFLTLEDESALANLIVWRRIAERDRGAMMSAYLLALTARVQRAEGVTHLIAESPSDIGIKVYSMLRTCGGAC
ncbi:MAG: error-prone DNA polymerase [Pseudomonadota bacterium]